MIAKMLHLDLVCLDSERKRALTELGSLGAVHLNLASAVGAAVTEAGEEIERAAKAVRLILKARGKTPRDDFEIRPKTVEEVLAVAADRERLLTEKDRLEREIKRYAPYGDFDPVLAQKLLDRGIDLKDELPPLLPEMRLSKFEEKLARVENRVRLDDARLSQTDEFAITARFPKLKAALSFEQAKELMSAYGRLAALSGWVPAERVDELAAAAKANGWAILTRERMPGEEPPVLIEPPRFFKSVKALFDGLGIAPAYDEGDVSVAFLGYFSLFFAMLVGDGAYGAIFLLATLWGWKKYRSLSEAAKNPVMRSWLILMTIFSSATIVWGLLSNTWFGANLPFAKEWPTVKWLADPSYQNMMLLCFTIGVSHLMLARIWNGVLKINSLDSLAEFGWAGVLFFMYLVTNSVVGIFAWIPGWSFYVLGVSVVLIVSRTRGAALGMLPLNIMSALGDIISYVRLFAVGLASVKVAENFNQMAIGLVSGDKVWYMKAVLSLALVAILVIGHTLNLAMAGLSILVHAVRLNTLEFSNHKGVSWSGDRFRPFKGKSLT